MFTAEELDKRLADASKAPRTFKVSLICIRQKQSPNATKETIKKHPRHTCPTHVECSETSGLIGDRWQAGDHANSQITLVDTRIIKAISESQDDWHKNGDNFVCDLPISRDMLKSGQKLQLGDNVVIEVNDAEHDACNRFAARHGVDAFKWINSKEGKANRRRGIKARIIKGGTVSCDDLIQIL